MAPAVASVNVCGSRDYFPNVLNPAHLSQLALSHQTETYVVTFCIRTQGNQRVFLNESKDKSAPPRRAEHAIGSTSQPIAATRFGTARALLRA